MTAIERIVWVFVVAASCMITIAINASIARTISHGIPEHSHQHTHPATEPCDCSAAIRQLTTWFNNLTDRVQQLQTNQPDAGDDTDRVEKLETKAADLTKKQQEILAFIDETRRLANLILARMDATDAYHNANLRMADARFGMLLHTKTEAERARMGREGMEYRAQADRLFAKYNDLLKTFEEQQARPEGLSR